MKFGVTQQTQPEPGQPLDQALRKVVDVCQLAEELGFVTFSLAEQHFTPYIVNPDSLQLFTFLAAQTTRIRFASGIIVVPLHHPIQLAERVALLDVLSGGRFDLGVGRGHIVRAFEGMNIPMAEAADRFDEAMKVAKLAWGDEPFTYHGRWYQTPEAISVNPKPLQKPHPPLWAAAVSTYSLDKIASQDYGLLVSFTDDFETSRARIEAYQQLRRAAGLPESGDRVRMNPLTLVLDSRQEAEEIAERHVRAWSTLFASANSKTPEGESYAHQRSEQWRRLRQLDGDFSFADVAEHAIFGDPDFAVERIVWLRDVVGTKELNFSVGFGGIPADTIKRSLRLLAEEVIPRVQATSPRPANSASVVAS